MESESTMVIGLKIPRGYGKGTKGGLVMKQKIKSIIAIMLVAVLIITAVPTNVSAVDWGDVDIGAEREYSNPYSSGTITYEKKGDNVRLSYSSGKVVEFLNHGMETENSAMTDGFGTAYFYKEISKSGDRPYQLYYYNKDINKNSNMEPLLNESGNYVYTGSAYHWDYNNDGTITIQRVVTDDGDIMGTFTPNFNLMKLQYDEAHPNMTPEPDAPAQTAAATNTPAPTPKNTPTPSNTPSAQPQQTAQPVPTQGSDYETGTKVAKSGNSIEATQNGEVIASVTFNKKKAVANFKIGEKSKKVKKVKQAFIIGESYNYGYITKSNKFKTVNRETGKVKAYSGKWKKAIIKKNVAIKIVKQKGSKKKTITGF